MKKLLPFICFAFFIPLLSLSAQGSDPHSGVHISATEGYLFVTYLDGDYYEISDENGETLGAIDASDVGPTLDAVLGSDREHVSFDGDYVDYADVEIVQDVVDEVSASPGDVQVSYGVMAYQGDVRFFGEINGVGTSTFSDDNGVQAFEDFVDLAADLIDIDPYAWDSFDLGRVEDAMYTFSETVVNTVVDTVTDIWDGFTDAVDDVIDWFF